MRNISYSNEVTAHFYTATKELLQLLSSLNTEELNRSIEADRWSAGQIGEHLWKAYAVVETLEGKVESTSRSPDQKVESIKAIFLNFDIQMKSPKAILPSNDPINKELLMNRLNNRMGKLISSLEDNDLSLVCLDFVIPKYGPFTRLEWAWFNVVHTQRHVKQLKKVIHSVSTE